MGEGGTGGDRGQHRAGGCGSAPCPSAGRGLREGLGQRGPGGAFPGRGEPVPHLTPTPPGFPNSPLNRPKTRATSGLSCQRGSRQRREPPRAGLAPCQRRSAVVRDG